MRWRYFCWVDLFEYEAAPIRCSFIHNRYCPIRHKVLCCLATTILINQSCGLFQQEQTSTKFQRHIRQVGFQRNCRLFSTSYIRLPIIQSTSFSNLPGYSQPCSIYLSLRHSWEVSLLRRHQTSSSLFVEDY